MLKITREDGLKIENYFCKNNFENLKKHLIDKITDGEYFGPDKMKIDGWVDLSLDGHDYFGRPFDFKTTGWQHFELQGMFGLGKDCYDALSKKGLLVIYSAQERHLRIIDVEKCPVVNANYKFHENNYGVRIDTNPGIIFDEFVPLPADLRYILDCYET